MQSLRSSRNWAAVCALALPLAVYVGTAYVNPGFWDMSEMATVSYLLGIAHPTGFPLFVVLGWLLSHAIPFGTVAWRVALVAAFGGGAAAFALWFALDAIDVAPWFATGAAWWFAFGSIVLERARRPEVHTLELGCEALALAFAIRFNRRGGRAWAIAASFAEGGALATHPNAIWALPALLILLCTRRGLPFARMIGALLLPLLSYLYIPLRSNYLATHHVDPTLAIGVPPGQPFWNYGDPHTLGRFWWLITGQQFPTHHALLAVFDPREYLGALGQFASTAIADHSVATLLIGVVGFVVLLRRARVVGIALASGFFGWCAFAHAYTPIEVDITRFYFSPLWILTLCAACTWFLLPRIARLPAWATAFVLVAGFASLWFQRDRLEMRSAMLAVPYIARAEGLTGPHDVIVASWAYATPLGYAKYVDGSMGDRIVVYVEVPRDAALIASLARKYRTDLVMEGDAKIPGVRLEMIIGEDDPIYRVLPVR